MFANAGEMKMLVLAPDAELSDGLIDVIAVDAHAGLLGWADVTWKMLGQLIGKQGLVLAGVVAQDLQDSHGAIGGKRSGSSGGGLVVFNSGFGHGAHILSVSGRWWL